MYAMDKPKTCSKCQFYGEQNNFHYQYLCLLLLQLYCENGHAQFLLICLGLGLLFGDLVKVFCFALLVALHLVL